MASILPPSLMKRVPTIIALAMTVFFVRLTFHHRDLIDDSFLTRLENRWIDSKFQFRGQRRPGSEVVIVGIDDKTTGTLGSIRTLSHDKWATLIDKLSEAHPKVIGFDILFPDRDESNPQNDGKFAAALKRAGNVVVGVELDLQEEISTVHTSTPMTPELDKIVSNKPVFPVADRGKKPLETSAYFEGRTLQLPLPELLDASLTFGFVNFGLDTEGRYRHQPQFIDYQGNLYPSLDIQLLRAYQTGASSTVTIKEGQFVSVEVGDYDIPTDKYGRFMLNFNGPHGVSPIVSMADVLTGKVPADVLKDKIVLIGAEEIGYGDIRATPFDPVLPGVELHANILDNIIHQSYVKLDSTTDAVDVAIILIFGLLLGIYLPRLDAKRSVTYTLLLFVLFTIVNVLAFTIKEWILLEFYPAMALLFIGGGMISFKYFTEERERNRTKQTFQYYLDENVMELVMSQPDALKLGGEKRDMSVLFSDIRSFTSFSEKMEPKDVVHFLNVYFDKMEGLIFRHKGTLDKLIGDAVMAFWGHPIPTEQHALQATLCALEMIQAVEDLRPVLILPGGARFEIGIGVNTGPMVVGNMGSQRRMSYTLMGDNVNLGSRLEAMNKYYGTQILISGSTYEACKHIIFCRELDTIQVKGKSQAVTIYEPIGTRPLEHNRRLADRRGPLTVAKRVKRAIVLAQHGERRHFDRRAAADRLIVKPAQEEIATIYGHALALYRKADFDAAERAFDHVLTLNPTDGPSRLMKGRIARYRAEYAGTESSFDPVYKFDEK